MPTAVTEKHENASVRSVTAWLAGSAFVYALVLTLTITTRSLSTDEAFSAYIADHRSVASLISTLYRGDSSDLQMIMHYLYMHFWVLLFGSDEYTLRAANIPFIILFAFSLVWGSWRVFGARWSWIGAAFFPFVCLYASEARAYLTLVSLSTLCVACLLAYLCNPSSLERRWLPRIALGALIIGATFHMLMLLAALPIGVLLFVCMRLKPAPTFWADWNPAVRIFALPYLIVFSYLGWTFLRGTSYAYQRPTVLSMGSLAYRFLGVFGFGPNRHYDISFHPYLLSIGIAGTLLAISFAGMVWAGWRRGNRPLLAALLLACFTSALLVLALSLAAGQQIELRHLAALSPFLLFFIVGCLSEQKGDPRSLIAITSMVLITLVWLVASWRLLFLPENRWEDFRGSVRKAITLSRTEGASLALVADPAAGAYYGLDLTGKAPCFPLSDDCSTGFKKVNWHHEAAAIYGVNWTASQISTWWSVQERRGNPIVVVISRARHPMYKDSPWWTFINARKYKLYSMHGFFVCLFH